VPPTTSPRLRVGGLPERVERVTCTLHGSLGATGLGVDALARDQLLCRGYRRWARMEETERGHIMADRNYTLFIGAYDDEASARADFATIKDLDDLAVEAAVVLSRDAQGKVEVKEHGGGLISRGTAIGAVGGLVVGLFAPPLLLAGVVGAGIGAGVAKIAKHHDEKKLGVDAQEWLPADSSAIVAVVDDRYLDRIDAAFEKATKKIGKAVDKGDYDDVVKAVNEGDEKIVEAIES